MKVVFLDFDGPIIPLMSHKPVHRGAMEKAWPPCVAALNRITDTTGAMIVVSSMWRLGGLMDCKEHLHNWGVTGKVQAITPYFEYVPGKTRGLEIAAYIEQVKDTRREIESFVILDDENDMPDLLHRLIITPFEVGLTEADADKAIQLLANQ